MLKLLLSFVFILSPSFAQDSCPTDARGLIKFRNSLIEDYSNGGLSTKSAEKVLSQIDKCYKETPKCFDDLFYYLDKKVNSHKYPMKSTSNLDKSDLTISSIKDLPKEFWGKRDNKGEPESIIFPENIEEIAKKKNWPNVLYKTRGSGGFDSGENLYIVVIPGEDKDIVMQVSPEPDKDSVKNGKKSRPNPAEGIHKSQETLTIITVDKTKVPRVGQLRLLSNGYKVDGVRHYKFSNETSVGDCLSCHSKPFRSISPRGFENIQEDIEEKMSEEEAAKVHAVNQVLTTENMTWGSKIISGKEMRLGPNLNEYWLGWATEKVDTKSDSFLEKCASSRKSFYHYALGSTYEKDFEWDEKQKIDLNKVRSAMNCVECHDGKQQGVLHSNFSSDEVKFKIIVDHKMPPNVALNENERIALYNCLYAQRNEILSHRDENRNNIWEAEGYWMKQTSCRGKQFESANPLKNNSNSEGTSSKGRDI